MAITKIMTINESPGDMTKHLKHAIDYICNPNKTRNGDLVGTLNCSKGNAFRAMLLTKEIYNKKDKRQGYHIILSFNPGEVDPDTAYQVMNEFARAYIGMNYECVFSVHEDKEHVHGHLIFNSVSCIDGLKYRYVNGDWAREIQPITNRICEHYGLETIDVALPGVCRKESYAAWENSTFKKSQAEIMSLLKEKLDEYISQSSSIEDLVDRLRNEGIVVRQGKYLSLKLPGQEKGIRTHRLGFGYSLESIKKRIKGESVTMPEIEVGATDDSIIKRAGYRASGKRRMKNEQWKYKAEINKLQAINQANTYMEAHGLKSMQDIVMRREQLVQRSKEIAKSRKNIFSERREWQEAITIIKNNPIEVAKDKLKKMGYNPDELVAFETATAKKLDNLFFEKRNIIREQNMLDSIEDLYDKAHRRAVPKDTI